MAAGTDGQNLTAPSDGPSGLLSMSGDKSFEDLPKEMLKLFKEVSVYVDKIVKAWGDGIKETQKATGQMGNNTPGSGRLGLGSFTRTEKAVGLGLGAMAVGSTYMSMAPNTMAAVTQRMGADTYAGISGMSSRQAIMQANAQVGGGATSAMGPTMAAMNLAYSGGYTANSVSSKNVMGQLGGLSAITGMSNEQAAGAMAGVNGMTFLRAGIRARDAQGNLKPPNELINQAFSFLYRGGKVTKEQAAMVFNPNSRGYSTLQALSGGDPALMQTLQSGIMARASSGKAITASQMHDPNTMLNLMGVDQSSPIRANFRYNSSENRKLAATEQGLVGGYDASLRTTAALNDAYSTMAGLLGPVNKGLMTLKGILQTMPNAGGMGGTVSGLVSTAGGIASSAMQYHMMGKFLGSKTAQSVEKKAAGGFFKRFLSKGIGKGLALGAGFLAGEALDPAGGGLIADALITGATSAIDNGGPSNHGNLGTGADQGSGSHADHVMPVPKGTPITSPYGPRSSRSTHGVGSTNHKGIDFGVKEGSPVYSIAAGKVVETGSGGGYGNYVVVQHADGTKSRYAHLKAILVSKNQKVGAGAQVGRSGGRPGTPGAGNSTGPHLHLEVTNKSGVKINPAPYLAGAGSGHSSAPVAKNYISGKPGASTPGSVRPLSDYSSPSLASLLDNLTSDGDPISWGDVTKHASKNQLSNIIGNIPEYKGPITNDKKALIKTIAGKGFHGKALQTAYAIALAESGGRPNALGDVGLQDSKWGPSVGLFQIRSLKNWKAYNDPYRDAQRLPNPYYNSEAAYSKSNQGKNFNAWSTYNSGAFLKHLGEAGSMAQAAGVGGPVEGVNLPNGSNYTSSGGATIKLDMKVHIQQASVAEADRLVKMVAQKLQNDHTLKMIASSL
jgi:murein DD-endopeptidase MepM/ murein hydrolase activator NlpD